MSAEPKDVVRRAYEGWNALETEALRNLYHPDAVYDASERILNPEVYEGHDALRRFGAEVRRDWRSFQVEVEELIQLDDERVLALHRSRAVGHASGVEVPEADSATLWTIRNGQVMHAKLFLQRSKAFEEARIPHSSAE